MSTAIKLMIRKDWMLNRFSYNARQHSRNKSYQVRTMQPTFMGLNSFAKRLIICTIIQ